MNKQMLQGFLANFTDMSYFFTKADQQKICIPSKKFGKVITFFSISHKMFSLKTTSLALSPTENLGPYGKQTISFHNLIWSANNQREKKPTAISSHDIQRLLRLWRVQTISFMCLETLKKIP